MEKEPESLSHRQELAVTLLQGGNAWGGSRRFLTQALALAPHNQATLAYLTLAARELGDSLFSNLFDAEQLVREYELPVPRGFADAASFNRALAEQLELLHTRRAAPLDQTLRGGTQTAPGLFVREVREIGLLRDAIRECVADYIKTLPEDAAHPFLSRRSEQFDFSGSWSCRLGRGGFHTNHIHEEGWISSAYYAALPGTIQDGPEGALKFGEVPLRSQCARQGYTPGPSQGRQAGAVPFLFLARHRKLHRINAASCRGLRCDTSLEAHRCRRQTPPRPG